MMRLTVFLAFAALAAAPSTARGQSGANAPAARPTRPVDECGAPVARARPRRNTPRPATVASGAGQSSAPGPRLLGVPAGGNAAEESQSAASGNQPQIPAQSSTSATGTAASQQSAQSAASPSGAAGAQTASTGSQPQNPAQSSTSATGTAASQQSAQSAHSGTETADPRYSSQSSTGAADPRASSVSAEATNASSTRVETQFLSGSGSLNPDPDPREARRNRDALRLGMGRLGDQVRLGPAASVSIPTAFGVDAGEMFFGVAFQGRTRYTEESDAAAVVGVGVGTRRVVALEAALTTYSTIRGSVLETGGVSFKLHRTLPRQTSVAVGWENAILWGGSDDRGSLYAAATRLLNLRENPSAPFSTAVVTLGVGNGRFRFEDDDAAGRETVNLFAAAGARVNPYLSLVADWTGQDLNMAASVTPVRRVPVVITAGLADLTGRAGDGARFILSLGYGLAFRQPF